MFARQDGDGLSRLRIPDVDGGILSYLSRGNDIAVFLSVVHRHGNDVIRVTQVELLSAARNVMDDTRTSRGIDDRLVIGQVEEIVSTIEASIAVNVIQLKILEVQSRSKIVFIDPYANRSARFVLQLRLVVVRSATDPCGQETEGSTRSRREAIPLRVVRLHYLMATLIIASSSSTFRFDGLTFARLEKPKRSVERTNERETYIGFRLTLVVGRGRPLFSAFARIGLIRKRLL